MKFKRITIDPERISGVPCIINLRIPVATIIGMLAEGMTEEEILKMYTDLESENIKEALKLAAETLRKREISLIK